MKRSEKIELIKSGKYIIENDMKVSEEAEMVLNSFKHIDWLTVGSFYGLDQSSIFTVLSNSELNDRPRFKMSELVEVEMEMEVTSTYQGLFNLLSKEHGITLTISEMDEIIIESAKISKTIEPKEVFTAEMIHDLREFYWSDTLEQTANKLNQMAFDAYKNK